MSTGYLPHLQSEIQNAPLASLNLPLCLTKIHSQFLHFFKWIEWMFHFHKVQLYNSFLTSYSNLMFCYSLFEFSWSFPYILFSLYEISLLTWSILSASKLLCFQTFLSDFKLSSVYTCDLSSQIMVLVLTWIMIGRAVTDDCFHYWLICWLFL